MEILEFRDVSYSYPEQNDKVLKNISFFVHEGEVIVLCGQSGCGKSTLFRHIKKNQITAGTRSGEILFYGKEIENLSDRRCAEEIGFVGQNPDGQIVTDKVWHELAFGLESLGVPNKDIRRRVGEMAEYFGIGHLFDKKTDSLSGGQKQILNLASVMVMRPKLLILDEPTSQLDPIAAERFIHTIDKLNQDFGITIILSEQRLEEVIPIASRVMVMHKGVLMGVEIPKRCGQMILTSKSPVYQALPAPMKLFLEQGGNGDEPLTIRDGARWLRTSGFAEKIKEKCDNDEIKKENSIWLSNNKKYVLEAKGVYYSYEKKGEKTILQDFNLKVPEGCVYAIMGGNGSGKTTALKILAGIYKPQRGKVKVNKRVVYLPQNPQLVFTEPTVCEELEEVFVGHGKLFQDMKEEEIVNRMEDMLKWMNLYELQHMNPFDLSGGQQQRLALAKVLLLQPDILLLDEPTKGLDAAFKEKLAALLLELSQKGLTIILVSHDVDFCAEHADYCGLLFHGELTNIEKTNKFFLNNYFYTTAISRMCQCIDSQSEIVTYTQAIKQFRK